MATATELSTKALRRIGVVNPSAEDVSDANEALNEMISSWSATAIAVTLPLDAVFDQAIIAMLGVRMAEDYGKEPGPVLAEDAKRGIQQIRANFITSAEAAFDDALMYLPANRRAVAVTASTDTLSFGDTVITWS